MATSPGGCLCEAHGNTYPLSLAEFIIAQPPRSMQEVTERFLYSIIGGSHGLLADVVEIWYNRNAVFRLALF